MHAFKSCGGVEWNTSPLIRKLSTGKRWAFSFSPNPPLYPRKTCRYLLNSRLVGTKSHSEFLRKNLLPLSWSRTTISWPFSPWPCHYAATLFSFSILTKSNLFLNLESHKKIFREGKGEWEWLGKEEFLQIYSEKGDKEVTNAKNLWIKRARNYLGSSLGLNAHEFDQTIISVVKWANICNTCYTNVNS
jgi:hypothetical protein